jgi:predicted NBD/HSP70 family sugar kinase
MPLRRARLHRGFSRDYALYRDAQLMDQRPAPTSLMPSEAPCSASSTAKRGDRALLDLVSRARRGLRRRGRILIQTLEPDHVVICGPARGPGPHRARVDDALAPRVDPELAPAHRCAVVESSHDLLTEGVIFQGLRELDAALLRRCRRVGGALAAER